MKGILFKPDMNLAIREGRKTVTRRLINPQPIIDRGIMRWNKGKVISINMTHNDDLAKPYAPYLPGETVYVKESWCAACAQDTFDETCYKLDGNKPDCTVWKSPMFMPEWAARTFLLIKDVRPEWLQEIVNGRHDEVLKEGWPFGYELMDLQESTITTFIRYWDSINKEPGTRWTDSPWVWRIEFEVQK